MISALTDLNRVYLSASLAALPLLALWSLRRRSQRLAMANVPSKTVVIVGAAWAGINVAHGLLKQVPNVKVVLINPSEEFYFNIASPRIIARPNAFTREKYMYSIPDLFDKYPSEVKAGFEFVIGEATAIDVKGKTVSVTEGAETSRDIAYDYLVISSGSTSKATLGGDSLKVPFKASKDSNTDSDIKNSQDAIQAAKSVIIGGAGAVGVEFAAELAEERPDVKVTLVTPTDRVLPTLKDGPRAKAAKVLKSKGIEIVTKEAVESARFDAAANNWTVTLTTGQILTADVYVTAAGAVPNNEFIPSALLDEDGWVDVDRHFRASRIPLSANIYAVGDITSHPQRIASRMPTLTGTVVSNLKADILGKGSRATFDAAKQGVLLAVPLGKSDGTGQMGWIVLPGFVLAFFKGKDYMTGIGKKLVYG
ncbi:hypothetical protein PISL3812_04564 [Talaromyces islandicus]|uniref:FAD/NAD(P)-binding domain-containing protein n=1 Tax=Talaromyces islandicus TaxID=28573 RepID=A0A0U1LXI4_TALIS|nr:hypothetical protein PISL3812_04564 [Talaromyces islandicus]